MDISVRFACDAMAYVTVTEGDTTITTDVCNMRGAADEGFIQQLRDVADKLEQFNEKNK